MDEKLYSQIIKLIVRRDRTKKEILDYLKNEKVTEEDSDLIIKRLESSNYLNDSRLAENKIYSRLKNKHWGIWKIRKELEGLGVDRNIIFQKLDTISDEEWESSCIACIKRINSSDPVKLRNKLYSFGHEDHIIKSSFTKLHINLDIDYELPDRDTYV